MVKEITHIVVQRDTHKDLMLFKISSNAKSLDEVIKLMIKKLKEEVKSNDLQIFEKTGVVEINTEEPVYSDEKRD